MKGKNQVDIRREFARIVETMESDCRKVNGEWLVPRWMGLQVRSGFGTSQAAETSRTCNDVGSSEELRTMQASGSQLVSQFQAAVVPVRGSNPYAGDAPAVQDVAQSDQPRAALAADVMVGAINREVSPHLVVGARASHR